MFPKPSFSLRNVSVFSFLFCGLLTFAIFAPPAANAATSVAGNLITNPNMQAATVVSSSPDFWLQGSDGSPAVTYQYPVSGPMSGDVAAQVTVTAANGGSAEWFFQHVAVTPGALYQFNDSYNANVDSVLVLWFKLTDGTNKFQTLASLHATNGSWAATPDEFFLAPTNASSVTVLHLIQANGTLATTNYSLIVANSVANSFSHGMVSIAFDDGFASQFTNAEPILAAAHMPGTFYVLTDQVIAASTTPGSAYMNPSQLLSLQSAGNEIDSQTKDKCDLLKLLGDPNSATTNACETPLAASSTVQSQIIGSRATLLDLGFSPVATLAYPFGSYDSTIEGIASSDGYSAAHSLDFGYNTAVTDKFALKVGIVDATTAFSTVQSWIDTADAAHLWLVLLFHRVEAGSGSTAATTPGTFQQIVSYLAAKQSAHGLLVPTVDQALAMAGVTTPTTNPTSTTPVATSTPTSTIGVAPTIRILTTSLATGTVGTPYSATLLATSTNATDTFTWALTSGALPGGFVFGTSTGVLSGTPIATGTATFAISVAGANPSSTMATGTFTLFVDVASATSTATSTTTATSSNTTVSSGGGGGGVVVGVASSYPAPASSGGGSVSVIPSPSVSNPLIPGIPNTGAPSGGGQVLGASTTVQFNVNLGRGARGSAVAALQMQLASMGFFKGPSTGFFGLLTAKAVKAFQKQQNLPQTGYFGPMTRAVMNRLLTGA